MRGSTAAPGVAAAAAAEAAAAAAAAAAVGVEGLKDSGERKVALAAFASLEDTATLMMLRELKRRWPLQALESRKKTRQATKAAASVVALEGKEGVLRRVAKRWQATSWEKRACCALPLPRAITPCVNHARACARRILLTAPSMHSSHSASAWARVRDRPLLDSV